MCINQACLRWLGAVFRLQLFRLGIFSIGSKTRDAFLLTTISGSASPGAVSQLYPFTP
jgi:hypothetical protein